MVLSLNSPRWQFFIAINNINFNSISNLSPILKSAFLNTVQSSPVPQHEKLQIDGYGIFLQ